MNALFEQIFVLCLFIGLGWVLGKWKPENAQKGSVLSFLLVNLFFPCKLFLNFATSFTVDYVRSNYTTFFFSIGFLAVFSLLSLPISRLLTKHPYERKVYSYSTNICNYGYFGYVLVEQVFGTAAMNNMMVFCIPYSLYCYTIGVSMLMDKKISLKSLLNTVTVSIALGIIWGLFRLPLPGAIQTVMKNASGCVGPVSMVVVGLVLSTFSLKDLLTNGQVIAFCLIRLLALPALVLGICKGLECFITLPEAVYPAALLVNCMPCGLNPVVFPKLIGQDCRLGGKLILLSSILCCATIPMWLWLIGAL